ncbi:hypothetical protein [Streptomyces malaysiensis]|uniref:hypothetical protein n=1 Tax=Streptomyces malaysiensis TaxID=92644 RepID=UPI0036B06078
MICADELGPVIPRTFPPAPAWSPDGHRIKAELDYTRGPEKTWVHGGLRPSDGQAVTMTAPSRNSAFHQQFLAYHAAGWSAVSALGTALPLLGLLYWCTERRARRRTAQ